MPEEWFNVAYINFDKAILHGRACDGFDEFRVRKERNVEMVLTDAQRRQIEDLSSDHREAMQKLLASFAHQVPA